MSQVSSMEYDRVRRLANQVSDAAEALRQGGTALGVGPSVGFTVPNPFGDDSVIPLGTAFGNTDNASACQSAYHQVQGTGGTATEHLGAVLNSDVERLGQVISCFQQTDHESADRICAAGGDTLNVYTTHVHSGSRGEVGPDDTERADQINQAVDAVAANPGPTVFTGDLNIDYDDPRLGDDGVPESETESAAAVERFEDELGFENAGDAAGPTSGYGEGGEIDYVFTSPDLDPDSANAENIDGDPGGDKDLSDHNGIAVDIEIPPGW